MVRTIALVFTVLMLISSLLSPISAFAFDPQSLVGEWAGKWSTRGMSDKIELTVKLVNDGDVTASVRIYSRARYANKDLLISGTVSPEGILFLKNEYFVLSLTVVDRGMSGKGDTLDFTGIDLIFTKTK